MSTTGALYPLKPQMLIPACNVVEVMRVEGTATHVRPCV
jgi:hypothetical protein